MTEPTKLRAIRVFPFPQDPTLIHDVCVAATPYASAMLGRPVCVQTHLGARGRLDSTAHVTLNAMDDYGEAWVVLKLHEGDEDNDAVWFVPDDVLECPVGSKAILALFLALPHIVDGDDDHMDTRAAGFIAWGPSGVPLAACRTLPEGEAKIRLRELRTGFSADYGWCPATSEAIAAMGPDGMNANAELVRDRGIVFAKDEVSE